MKKFLALVAVATIGLSAFGQGQIQFNNRVTAVTPNISAPIYLDTVGGTALSGSAYRAALLGGATTATPWVVSTAAVSGGAGMSLLASPTTGATYMTFKTGAAAGLLAVGSDAARAATVDWNKAGLFQVVAWSGNYTDWSSAVAAALTDTSVKIGASNPLNLTTPLSISDPNVTYLTGLNSFAIVSVNAVPEPSTMALAGLGAAALLIFRRRK